MSNEKTLYLLDGFALIYRAYFAFIKSPRLTSTGMNTSAVFGFTNTLTDLLRNEYITHVALVLDAPGPTQRAQEHEFYKANREEMPEDIRTAIPYIKKVAEAFNIPILLKEGYEADDIIGTLAKAAEKEDFKVYMVTPDKDYGQLVSENIFMYKPAGWGKPRSILGVPEILEKWDIENVLQVIDILGLMGDASDNIPGIPGVGEKTAIKLLKQFGSIENMLKNTDQLKGKLKEKVEINQDKAIISKSLATIILDVPVEYYFESFKIENPNKEALTELFKELEFNTIGKRILGEDFTANTKVKTKSKKAKSAKGQLDLFAPAPPNAAQAELVADVQHGKNIETVEHTYHLVDTAKAQKDLVKKLLKEKAVCFDTETTGLDANEADLIGIAFSFKAGEAYYVPIPPERADALKVVELFKPFFESEKITKIGQNIKYDMLILKWYDVEVNGDIVDTMIQHYLIEPDMRHNLNYLSESYLGYTPVSIESLIGKKGKNQKNMKDIPIEQVKEYAGEDADLTWQLYEHFSPIMKKHDLEKLYSTMEAPLIKVLTDIEHEGIALDVDFLKDYSDELTKEIGQLTTDIQNIVGEEFNLDSPKQLGNILFDTLKIPYKGKKTKTGQYSTNEETLAKLANDQPVVKKVLEYRGMNKLLNTYIDALPKLINSKTGRIHSSFNQAVASTGRLSSSNPNLQNIPIRTERGREVRKAFIPRDKDHIILAADYSQIELRIIAEISGDKAMKNAFKEGIDIHAATAAKVFNIPLKDVDSEKRRQAKMVNFGIIYSISAFGLSQRLGIKRSAAAELIEAYFKEYPNIKTYMEDSVKNAREKGYAETILGRRRYLKDITSRNHTVKSFAERIAINMPIQGAAADMIKLAMIKVHAAMKKAKMQSKMILQVHDELVFDARKDELEALKALVKKNMEGAVKMDVPIIVEMGTGANWLEAH